MVMKVAAGVVLGLLAYALVTGWFQSSEPYWRCANGYSRGLRWVELSPGNWGCLNTSTPTPVSTPAGA